MWNEPRMRDNILSLNILKSSNTDFPTIKFIDKDSPLVGVNTHEVYQNYEPGGTGLIFIHK